jgi:hypothetical protein
VFQLFRKQLIKIQDAVRRIHCHKIGQDMVLHKAKATPLQAMTTLEGFRSLRVPDFKAIGT